MTTEQLQDRLQKLVSTGLNSATFGGSELAELLVRLQPERPIDDWYGLVFRAVAGTGPEADPATQPSDPRFMAARTLYGLAPGMASASAAVRRDEASRFLRDRRPRDPYLPADAPLSGRQQRLKLQSLIAQMALDLERLLSEPVRSSATGSVVYDVLAVDYTVRCGRDGRAIEKIEDWSIVARRPMTHFPKTWALGDQDPSEMEMYCIGGQLAKTYDRQAGVLVTEVIFGQILDVGSERTIRLVTRFKAPTVDRHLTARSTRPASLIRIRLQLTPGIAARYAPITQGADYADHQFPTLAHVSAIDPSGYAEIKFTDMLSEFNYGIAWQLDSDEPA